ncbi:MAG: CDP-alcohol phosphatidyltransferase family protein [Alphaproteobacteria bacterium]|nr:CDP-alcohol phosphatidyltransferase family protein [Alphaproteobacteria bacterium]
MISVYDLKPRFQNLLRPLTESLFKAGVTANHVTLFAMVASVGYGAWIYAASSGVVGGSAASLLLLPVFLFFRMALNAIDGMLAREFKQKSDLGFYLNELGDVVADTALYLPFMFLLPNPMLVLMVVLLAILIEFAGVLALGVGNDRRYDGPFGKSDRAVAFGVLGYIMVFLNLPSMAYTGIFGVFIVLSIWTLHRRIKWGLNNG